MTHLPDTKPERDCPLLERVKTGLTGATLTAALADINDPTVSATTTARLIRNEGVAAWPDGIIRHRQGFCRCNPKQVTQ